MDFSAANLFFMGIGLIVGILSMASLIIYYQYPSLLIRIGVRFKRWQTGVKVKYASCKDYQFCYFCRGKSGPQPVMLMLHGFSLDKDMWLGIVELFPKDLNFICLDLPGHGETTRLPGESFTAIAQVERIHQFVECIGLNQKPFHLVGISLGGMIAGVYAAQYPSEVCCLSLMCPVGLRYPTDNDFVKRLKDLDMVPLFPSTIKELEGNQRLFLYHLRPNSNKQLLQGFLDYHIPQHAFFKKCLSDFASEDSRYSLHENMNKIKVPTQIIWGIHDKVIDPSGGEILATAIPHSQLHMLEKCGHFITIDVPRKSAKLLVEFHNSMCGKAETKKSR